MTGVERRGDSTRMNLVTTPSGARHTFIGGGVDATCAGQGNRLLADSAEYFQDRGVLNLFHNVRYTEGGTVLTSDRMTYLTLDEHLVADGRVTARSASGTRFTGPHVEYFRAVPGVRAASRWVATGRPFVRMSPSEMGEQPAAPPPARPVPTPPAAPAPRAENPPSAASTAAQRGDSTDLTADLVVSENDSLMWASGSVVIERTDLRATADSAMLDNGTEYARLMKDPVIVGQGERAFTLDGTVIDLWSRERKLERVRAADSGRVVSDSLTLTADSVDLRLSAQRIDRVYAWGGRALADAPAQRITADSLDILMPGQRLREVRAVGAARATSRVDSTRVVSDEPDWISGDTITALFDSSAVADSSAQPRMRSVLASGTARSFYQLAPSDTGRGVPSISYNRGRMITVAFEEGEMRTVDVVDAASGIYLEPAQADTTAGTAAAARRAGARPPARPAPVPPPARRP